MYNYLFMMMLIMNKIIEIGCKNIEAFLMS